MEFEQVNDALKYKTDKLRQVANELDELIKKVDTLQKEKDQLETIVISVLLQGDVVLPPDFQAAPLSRSAYEVFVVEESNDDPTKKNLRISLKAKDDAERKTLSSVDVFKKEFEKMDKSFEERGVFTLKKQ